MQFKPDEFFRAAINRMDDIEDCETYVAEYFSCKVPSHGEAVFTKLEDAEKFLFDVYAKATPYLRPTDRQSGWVRGRLQTAAYA